MNQLPRLLAEGRYLLVDIESTGLSIHVDEPVQIAFGCIDHGVTGLRGYWTLRPMLAALKEGATNKHGFTAEKLAFSPKFVDIADQLAELAASRIFLGWNVRRFDFRIIARMFETWHHPLAHTEHEHVLDVMLLEKALHPEGRHSLDVSAERWGVPLTNYHDAWHDCRIAWQIFGALAYRFPAVGAMSPRDVIDTLEQKKGFPNGNVPSEEVAAPDEEVA